jgi:hypothetical protein
MQAPDFTAPPAERTGTPTVSVVIIGRNEGER